MYFFINGPKEKDVMAATTVLTQIEFSINVPTPKHPQLKNALVWNPQHSQYILNSQLLPYPSDFNIPQLHIYSEN